MEDLKDQNQNKENSLSRKPSFWKMNYINILLQDRIEAALKAAEDLKEEE